MANGVFEPSLPASSGYALIIGGGLGFAFLMLALSWLQSRYSDNSPFETEEFSSASRSVKPGLICSGIVSAWTWSATLMVSSLVVYQFGVSGGWWYAVCGTIEIVFFSVIASKVKENANGARTFLEIVKARFGTPAHLMFLFYALFTSLMVSAILLLGGSASISALTGMDIRAATMLLPTGVIAFVVVGGLRSTFISDFVHTTIVFVIIWLFVYTACGASPHIGSPSRLHALLEAAAQITPVPGNAQNSYLTMRSKDGNIFAAISFTLGSSTVFLDQSYWQRAIASHPRGTTRAYFLGGISWFSVPFAFGTTMGLSARALERSSVFPTYPLPLSPAQQGAGLVAPAAAVALLGKSGAAAMLVVTYMAVTSAASAQLISVSSIMTYDVYRTYWRPKASASDMLRVAHLGVVGWGIWISVFCVILNAGNVDMNFVYYFCGTIIGSPIVPVILVVLWPKLSFPAILLGPLLGSILGILAWLVTCRLVYGSISTTTLAANLSSMAGSVVSVGVGAVVSIGLSLWRPDNYDFSGTRAIEIIKQDQPEDLSPACHAPDSDKKTGDPTVQVVESEEASDRLETGLDGTIDPANVKIAFWWSTFIVLIVSVVIPMPLIASNYVFSATFFTGWMVLAMVWSFFAGFACIILPIWESRATLNEIAHKIVEGYTIKGSY